MTHEFKHGQWLQNKTGNAVVCFNSFFRTGEFTTPEGAPYCIADYEPLTTREGDHVSTEGMTQEQWDEIYECPGFDCRKYKFLWASESTWIKTEEEQDFFKRELTIEQVMSTLEPEVITVKDNVMPENYTDSYVGKIGGGYFGVMSNDDETRKENDENYTDSYAEAFNPHQDFTPNKAPHQKPQFDWNKPYTSDFGHRCGIIFKSAFYTIMAITDEESTFDGDQFVVDSKTGRSVSGGFFIINVPEEHKLEGFMVALSTGGLMYTRYKNNMPPPHVIKAIIDLSKHNITYKHGEGLEE